VHTYQHFFAKDLYNLFTQIKVYEYIYGIFTPQHIAIQATFFGWLLRVICEQVLSPRLRLVNTHIYIGPCTISIYICTWATVKYKYDFHIRCIFPFPRLVVYSLIWFGCDIYRSLEPTVQWIIYFNAETDFICTSSPEPVNRPFSFLFFFFLFLLPLIHFAQ